MYVNRGRFEAGACCAVDFCNLFREKYDERVGSARLLQVLPLRNMQQNCNVSALAVTFSAADRLQILIHLRYC